MFSNLSKRETIILATFKLSSTNAFNSVKICYCNLRMSYSSNILPVLYDALLSLILGKVAIEKMTIINTFGPVLINGWCIGYMLADHSV